MWRTRRGTTSTCSAVAGAITATGIFGEHFFQILAGEYCAAFNPSPVKNGRKGSAELPYLTKTRPNRILYFFSSKIVLTNYNWPFRTGMIKNSTGFLIRIRMDFRRKVNESIRKLTFLLSYLRPQKSDIFIYFENSAASRALIRGSLGFLIL